MKKCLILLLFISAIVSCGHTTDSRVEGNDEVFVTKRKLLTLYPVSGSDTYEDGKNNLYVSQIGEIAFPDGWTVLKVEKEFSHSFWITVKNPAKEEYLYHISGMGLKSKTESVIKIK